MYDARLRAVSFSETAGRPAKVSSSAEFKLVDSHPNQARETSSGTNHETFRCAKRRPALGKDNS
jgi:hypothetical protein